MSTQNIKTDSSNAVFLDATGRVLAQGHLPAEIFIEGDQDRTVKEFEITAQVSADGKMDHFICTSPQGEAIKGAIVEKPAGGLGVFAVNRLEVRAGDVITGKMQALTVKEVAAA